MLTWSPARATRTSSPACRRTSAQSLSARPQKADEDYFTGKVLKTRGGRRDGDAADGEADDTYLVKNDYTDTERPHHGRYHEAKKEGTLAPLPPELGAIMRSRSSSSSTVFSTDKCRRSRTTGSKGESAQRELRQEGVPGALEPDNQKAVYTVHFETDELIGKCVKALDKELKVAPLQYTSSAASRRRDQHTRR